MQWAWRFRGNYELLREVLVEIRRVGKQTENLVDAIRPPQEPPSDDFYGAAAKRARTANEIANAAANRLRMAAIATPDLLPIIDRSTLVYGREGVYELAAGSALDHQILLENRKLLNDLAKEAGLGFAIHVIKPQREVSSA